MSTDPRMVPAPYERGAIYSYDADCVEYVQRDSFALYERIDSRLTLILGADGSLIGFKIKGFRNTFERLKSSLELSDGLFVPLVSAMEQIYSDLGDRVFPDDRVRNAYKAAYQLAANDNVKLSDVRFAQAA